MGNTPLASTSSGIERETSHELLFNILFNYFEFDDKPTMNGSVTDDTFNCLGRIFPFICSESKKLLQKFKILYIE